MYRVRSLSPLLQFLGKVLTLKFPPFHCFAAFFRGSSADLHHSFPVQLFPFWYPELHLLDPGSPAGFAWILLSPLPHVVAWGLS